MYLSVIISGFFAGISPFWGLLIIIAYGFKHYISNRTAVLSAFALTAAAAVLIFVPAYQVLAFSDAFLGVGITALIYFNQQLTSSSKHQAFLYASGYNLFYGVTRKILFKQIIMDQITQSSEQSKILLKEMFSQNPEMQSLADQTAQTSVQFYQDYSAAIWFFIAFSALYFGSQLAALRNKTSWDQQSFDLPYWFVYLLIGSMLMFLLPQTRIFGANLLLVLLLYFCLQGLAVSYYFWQKKVKNSKFTLFFIIACILLNYVLVIYLLVLGLADIWLRFRQKTNDIHKPL